MESLGRAPSVGFPWVGSSDPGVGSLAAIHGNDPWVGSAGKLAGWDPGATPRGRIHGPGTCLVVVKGAFWKKRTVPALV